MQELLFAHDEPRSETGVEGIMMVRPVTAPTAAMQSWLTMIKSGLANGDRAAALRALSDAIPDFRTEGP